MPNPLLDRIKRDAATASDEVRWAMIVRIEIALLNTPWWELRRQYKLRNLSRIYRKGLRK